jgi:hypothetical protein
VKQGFEEGGGATENNILRKWIPLQRKVDANSGGNTKRMRLGVVLLRIQNRIYRHGRRKTTSVKRTQNKSTGKKSKQEPRTKIIIIYQPFTNFFLVIKIKRPTYCEVVHNLHNIPCSFDKPGLSRF